MSAKIRLSHGMNAISKASVVFTVRVVLLIALLSSVLLCAGCASTTNMDPDDRDTFYSGWMNPNAKPPSQP